MSTNFRPNKKRDFWTGLNKLIGFISKQVIRLTALLAEVIRKLIEGAVALLGSNSFAFIVWSFGTVVSLYFSISGFPDMAMIALSSVGIPASKGVTTLLLAIGAGLNYVQLQPRLWKYWKSAARNELDADPNFNPVKLSPLLSFVYSFNLAVRRKNDTSKNAYVVEALIYVLSGLVLLLAGNPIVTIVYFIARSVIFLYAPELFMAMAFAMRTIALREKDPSPLLESPPTRTSSVFEKR